ncbi:MAG: lysophospholipid acyltransferase family protein [Ardenticatenaceae bacterium]
MTSTSPPDRPNQIINQATPLIENNLLRRSAKFILNLFGWQFEGDLPDLSKCVFVAAPHTSNWDFPLMLISAVHYGMKPYWMVKDTAIRWPIAGIARWLGALPINRRSSHNVVEQVVEAFNQHERIVVLVPPEGTRKRMPRWKSGFYYIALNANVPIVLSFLDFKRKVAGIGPTLYPTGDFEADMRIIQAFYADKQGKYPEQTSPVLPEE